jgi:hypothetical protein
MNNYEFYKFQLILLEYQSGKSYLKPIVDILMPRYLVELFKRNIIKI